MSESNNANNGIQPIEVDMFERNETPAEEPVTAETLLPNNDGLVVAGMGGLIPPQSQNSDMDTSSRHSIVDIQDSEDEDDDQSEASFANDTQQSSEHSAADDLDVSERGMSESIQNQETLTTWAGHYLPTPTTRNSILSSGSNHGTRERRRSSERSISFSPFVVVLDSEPPMHDDNDDTEDSRGDFAEKQPDSSFGNVQQGSGDGHPNFGDVQAGLISGMVRPAPPMDPLSSSSSSGSPAVEEDAGMSVGRTSSSELSHIGDIRTAEKIMSDSPHDDLDLSEQGLSDSVHTHDRLRTWADHYLPTTPQSANNSSSQSGRSERRDRSISFSPYIVVLENDALDNASQDDDVAMEENGSVEQTKESTPSDPPTPVSISSLSDSPTDSDGKDDSMSASSQGDDESSQGSSMSGSLLQSLSAIRRRVSSSLPNQNSLRNWADHYLPTSPRDSGSSQGTSTERRSSTSGRSISFSPFVVVLDRDSPPSESDEDSDEEFHDVPTPPSSHETPDTVQISPVNTFVGDSGGKDDGSAQILARSSSSNSSRSRNNSDEQFYDAADAVAAGTSDGDSDADGSYGVQGKPSITSSVASMLGVPQEMSTCSEGLLSGQGAASPSGLASPQDQAIPFGKRASFDMEDSSIDRSTEAQPSVDGEPRRSLNWTDFVKGFVATASSSSMDKSADGSDTDKISKKEALGDDGSKSMESLVLEDDTPSDSEEDISIEKPDETRSSLLFSGASAIVVSGFEKATSFGPRMFGRADETVASDADTAVGEPLQTQELVVQSSSPEIKAKNVLLARSTAERRTRSNKTTQVMASHAAQAAAGAASAGTLSATGSSGKKSVNSEVSSIGVQVGVAIGLVAVVIFGVSSGIAIAIGSSSPVPDAALVACGEHAERKQGRLSLIFENVPAAVLRKERRTIQDVFLASYNNASGMCEGLFERIMVDATMVDWRDVAPNAPMIATSWVCRVNCTGCPDNEPLFSDGLEGRRLEADSRFVYDYTGSNDFFSRFTQILNSNMLTFLNLSNFAAVISIDMETGQQDQIMTFVDGTDSSSTSPTSFRPLGDVEASVSPSVTPADYPAPSTTPASPPSTPTGYYPSAKPLADYDYPTRLPSPTSFPTGIAISTSAPSRWNQLTPSPSQDFSSPAPQDIPSQSPAESMQPTSPSLQTMFPSEIPSYRPSAGFRLQTLFFTEIPTSTPGQTADPANTVSPTSEQTTSPTTSISNNQSPTDSPVAPSTGTPPVADPSDANTLGPTITESPTLEQSTSEPGVPTFTNEPPTESPVVPTIATPPVAEPSATTSLEPTRDSMTPEPTIGPSTQSVSAEPSTTEPTSENVTNEPTHAPTLVPTLTPTIEPTVAPTLDPTSAPTSSPTAMPTGLPTIDPTDNPTNLPTLATPFPSPATPLPTAEDGVVVTTRNPTSPPTLPPTTAPTAPPTNPPTNPPTAPPTSVPTAPPTNQPTNLPTSPPTNQPTNPPTAPPTVTAGEPSASPTTRTPTSSPTNAPTEPPTAPPTNAPTSPPTNQPTNPPTSPPTDQPTNPPTSPPTNQPTNPYIPSHQPAN
ncbi:laminin G sub domain 2 [Seminavis robusta]|uniref:Laminin G sub domain 2 n=1 Tax=Seminavis robusta TaxID=568900 RepID=A0A9N8HK07_9STRA|nr:laminin G sub domain 2 [Seminavis robusta]|eukprot:Sro721_g192760.1 laminin G sub domain 2 (1554) ;mRNA; r:31628-36466